MGKYVVPLLPEKQRQARKYSIKTKIRKEFDRVSHELNVAYNNDLNMLRVNGVKITYSVTEQVYKYWGYQAYQKALQTMTGAALKKIK